VFGLAILFVVWFLPRPREVYIWLIDHGYGERLFHSLQSLPETGAYGAFLSAHWYHIIATVFVAWMIVLVTQIWRESRPVRLPPDNDRDRD